MMKNMENLALPLTLPAQTDGVSDTPPIPSGQELDDMETPDLLVLYKNTGDESLKWVLVLRYEWLVRSIALQICGVYASFAQVDDIVSEGVITLLQAIDKFDLSKNIKFETYVSKRIRGMIIDLARQQDWLPRSVRKRSREIDSAVTELYHTLGHYPTDAEICEKLGVSRAKYHEDLMHLDLSNVLSLEALLENRDTGDLGIGFSSGETSAQPEQNLQEEEFRDKLTEGIRTLRDNEQLVLSLYYQKELNMREIAQVMEVSEPRVSQIHSKAIQKLRHFLQSYMAAE
jgi:RNA polymerase sigma factor for flagellar operon FliA